MAATGPQSDGPIPVAAVFAVTGIAAQDNAPAVAGVQAAAAHINHHGGVLGRKVALMILDNRSTPLGSRSAARKAVELGALAVIGPAWSSHSQAAAAELDTAGIPMITPTATAPAVTLFRPFVFRACFTDTQQGGVLGQVAVHLLGASSAVVLQNVEEAYSLSLSQAFIAAFTRLGGSILWIGQYTGQAVDFTSLLARTRSLAPDLVFLPGYGRDSGLILRQAQKHEIHATFLGGDGWDGDLLRFAGRAAEGGYFATHWHPDIDAPQAAAMKVWASRSGAQDKAHNMRFALAWDAVHLWADAARRAGSVDPSAVRNALAATTGFSGVTGAITMNTDGDPLAKPVAVVQVRNQRPVLYKVFQPSPPRGLLSSGAIK